MKKLNIYKKLAVILAAVLCMPCFAACGNTTAAKTSTDAGKVNVVASIFPEYDFLRQIGGDKINLSMLLTPGAESHSFEPTPQDMKTVIASDLFVYVGGDSDAWVESILDSVNTDKTHIVTLMDCVDTVEEEHVEGMMEEEEEDDAKADGQKTDDHNSDRSSAADTENNSQSEVDEEIEYDEHVWTSPINAKRICQKLCDNLCEIDPANKESYQSNTSAYLAKLDQLDQQFRDVVSNAARKEIIVGDRFPFRYFVDEYGLTYYAAFPGCSTDTEANAATIAFLQNKVKTDQIPVVFHIELSNEKVCNAICEQTGAKSRLLNAVHNVSKKDFENGVTYIDLCQHNVEVLKEALN